MFPGDDARISTWEKISFYETRTGSRGAETRTQPYSTELDIRTTTRTFRVGRCWTRARPEVRCRRSKVDLWRHSSEEEGEETAAEKYLRADDRNNFSMLDVWGCPVASESFSRFLRRSCSRRGIRPPWRIMAERRILEVRSSTVRELRPNLIRAGFWNF